MGHRDFIDGNDSFFIIKVAIVRFDCLVVLPNQLTEITTTQRNNSLFYLCMRFVASFKIVKGIKLNSSDKWRIFRIA